MCSGGAGTCPMESCGYGHRRGSAEVFSAQAPDPRGSRAVLPPFAEALVPSTPDFFLQVAACESRDQASGDPLRFASFGPGNGGRPRCAGRGPGMAPAPFEPKGRRGMTCDLSASVVAEPVADQADGQFPLEAGCLGCAVVVRCGPRKGEFRGWNGFWRGRRRW